MSSTPIEADSAKGAEGAQVGESGCWTQPRIELLAWLTRNSPPLAELYQGAVELVFARPVPGRVCFVAHAVREIRNRLPDVISGVKGGGRLDYPSRLDEISQLWEQSGFPVDGSPATVTMMAGDPNVTVTTGLQMDRTLSSKIGRLVGDHKATREKPDEAALRLFLAVAPENAASTDSLGPIVREWKHVTDWFYHRAHISGRVDADCDAAELASNFEHFERILGALVRGFFSTAEGLDAILEDTNS